MKWGVLLLGFLLIPLAHGAVADQNDNILFAWTFDANTTNTATMNDSKYVPHNNCTHYNTPTIGGGMRNNSLLYETANSERSLCDIHPDRRDTLNTLAFWYNPTDDINYTTACCDILLDWDISDAQAFVAVGANAEGNLCAHETITFSDADNAKVSCWEEGHMPPGAWQFLAFVYNSSASNYDFFLNGTKQPFNHTAGGGTGQITLNAQFELAARQAGALYMDGRLDEMTGWNVSLDQADIDELWASGSGLYYDFGPGGGGSPTPGANFTITAKSLFNQTDIINFSATLNGSTWWSNASGVIETNISDNSTWNITITSYGFNTLSHQNYDTQRALQTNLSVNISLMNVNFSLTQTPSCWVIGTVCNGFIGPGCEYNENIFGPTTVNHLVYIHNIDDDTWANTDFTHSLNYTYVMDYVNYTCEILTPYERINHSESLLNVTPIDMVLTFNAVDEDNDLFGTAEWNFTFGGIEESANPMTQLMSTFTNRTVRSIETMLTVEPTIATHVGESFTVNITEDNQTMNFSLEPNQLSLQFFFPNGTAATTSGLITDVDKVRNWTNSSWVIYQTNLSTGKVIVNFQQTNFSNGTQYYEYLNTQTTTIDEDLYLLQTADWYGYIQILDYTQSPIENAEVRIEWSAQWIGSGWINHQLLGQRLTDSEGSTFFWGDYDMVSVITVEADGYESYANDLKLWGDNSYTRELPYKIWLRESTSSTNRTSLAWVPQTFTNRTVTIYGGVSAIAASTLTLQTAYRASQGSGPRSILSGCDRFYRCTFSLVPGVDYDTSGTADIKLNITRNGELLYDQNISYDNRTKTQFFDEDTWDGIAQGTLRPIIWILLILAAFMLSLGFSHEGMGEGVIKGGSFVVGFWVPAFWFVAGLYAIYWLIVKVKEVWSE